MYVCMCGCLCVCMYGGVSDTGRRMIEIPKTFHEMKDKKR
jgi:hypothetical protein